MTCVACLGNTPLLLFLSFRHESSLSESGDKGVALRFAETKTRKFQINTDISTQ
jgi:hypothetical protein